MKNRVLCLMTFCILTHAWGTQPPEAVKTVGEGIKRHHCAMSLTRHNFFEILDPKILPRVLRNLNGRSLWQSSCVTRTWYKPCMDIVDERRAEKKFQFSALDQEDRDYFNLHLHDILLIEDAYHHLKFHHQVYTLITIVKDHLEQTNALEKVRKDVLDDLIGKDSKKTPHLTDVTTLVLQELYQNQDYQNINRLINPLIDKDPSLSKRYSVEHYKVGRKLAEKVLEEKPAYQEDFVYVENSLPPQPSSSSSRWSFTYWLGKNTTQNQVPTISQESINDRYEKAQKQLVCHIKDAENQLYVLDIMKELNFADHSQLSLSDFMTIHKRIQAKKKADSHATRYMKIDEEEINAYKYSSPVFRDLLPY